MFNYCTVQKANNKGTKIPMSSTGGPGQLMSDTLHPTLLSPKNRVQAKIGAVKDQSLRGFVQDQSPLVSAQELASQGAALEKKLCEHVKTLRLHTSVPERYAAAEALAALGPAARSARSALETVLLRDGSVHVRKSLARALGDLGDKQAEPVLRQVLENDTDKFVRMRAQEALDVLNGILLPGFADEYTPLQRHGTYST